MKEKKDGGLWAEEEIRYRKFEDIRPNLSGDRVNCVAMAETTNFLFVD